MNVIKLQDSKEIVLIIILLFSTLVLTSMI